MHKKINGKKCFPQIMLLPVFEVCLEGPAGALLRLGSGGGCLRLVAWPFGA